MFKVLITGSRGFVGSNLIESLKTIRDGKETHSYFGCLKDYGELTILECSRETTDGELCEHLKEADFIVHLAGSNRPVREEEFEEINADFTKTITDKLRELGKKTPILYASSIQAERDNPYGQSKLKGEAAIEEYAEDTGASTYIYRFTNIFGKWCKPNYNSVVATFCHNIPRGIKISINNPDAELRLAYIDDVVAEIERVLAETMKNPGAKVEMKAIKEHEVTVGRLAELINEFSDMKPPAIPEVGDEFVKKLYSTYLSYVPGEKVSHQPKVNSDVRGSFTEFVRAEGFGQVSINISKPGITKGEHWHHTKTEKFMVVSGHGLIQMRRIGVDRSGEPYEILEYEVSGENPEIVDMLPGYTHNIINLSDSENLVTMMWANECFDPDRPDTFREEVIQG